MGGEWCTAAPISFGSAAKHLGTTVVVHEINHAAVSIYGSSLQGNEFAIDLLDTDLTGALVRRLYELGYYDRDGETPSTTHDPTRGRRR